VGLTCRWIGPGRGSELHSLGVPLATQLEAVRRPESLKVAVDPMASKTLGR
jgi:hypothetical protein